MQKSDLHVLIVDDDQTFGKAMKEAISRAGYKVTHVTKPDEALALFKLQTVHAAVIDCMLPKMNGRDLAKKMRAEFMSELPIILVSGIYKDKNFAREALQTTGAIAFLTKPFDLQEMLKLLDTQLSPLVDTPLLPINEAMLKENLSAKERIKAVNESEQVHGFDLPWIYSLLMHPRVNGHLNIITADGEVSGVGFQKGRIVQVSQKDTKSYFGALMVEHGFITQDEVDEVLKLAAKTRKVGERLVEANVLSPHAIQIVMAEQQAIRLSKTVADTSVKVNFIDSDEIREDADIDQADFADLLNDWINSKISSEWLKSSYLPWMSYTIKKGPEHTATHRILNLPLITRIPGLTTALLDSGHTLEQAIASLNAPEEHILRALHALIVSRVARFGELKKSGGDFELQRKRLQKLGQDLAKQTYFERLGVSQKAKDAEIKRNYHELAKILHTDKLEANVPDDIRELARVAFNLINDAHQTLSDPDKKESYLLELEQGRAEALLQAEQKVEQARTLLSKGDIGRGRKAIEEALAMVPPSPEMTLVHLWSRLKSPGIERSARSVEEIRDAISKIPAEDRHNALYYFVKGLLQKVSGDAEGARRSLEHAISIEPQSIDARRELNILNMQASPKSVDLLSGDLKDVVGMLFKKKK